MAAYLPSEVDPYDDRISKLRAKLRKLLNGPVYVLRDVNQHKAQHDSPAVYVIVTPNESQVVYAGRTISKTIAGRIHDHLYANQSSDLNVILTRHTDYPQKADEYGAKYLSETDDRERMLFEAFVISVLNPPFNR